MAQETKHGKARQAFEQLDIGEKISAAELAIKIGAASSAEKKNVGAFLSKEVKLGRATKNVGEDGRMYYEKIAPTERPRTPRSEASRTRAKDEVTLGEIGESIVDYIQKLRDTIADLESQKEESKRLYEEAERKVKDLSESQAEAQKTIRLSKLIEDSS